MGIAIEKKLTEAGYKMLGDDKSIETLILNILNKGDIRYLKAIPFLIYKHNVNIINIEMRLTKQLKRLFATILAMVDDIFRESNIKRGFPDYLTMGLENLDGSFGIQKLNYNEFKDEFELQLRNENKQNLFIDKQKIYAERDLQMYLSQLFTKKEKQIIGRLLGGKPISRTDYEYYSRKTKKKINSIIGLGDFAKTLFAKTPKYDEDLFYLKKSIEELLEKKSGDTEIVIIKFFIWDSDILSISYKKKTKGHSEDQIFSEQIKLSDIRDNEILNLLKIYKEHNFR